jgi:hypothetical protein
MGRETGWPSMMGLGHPPAALSKPFRLRMIFTCALAYFVISFLTQCLDMLANSPAFAVHMPESGKFDFVVASFSLSVRA